MTRNPIPGRIAALTASAALSLTFAAPAFAGTTPGVQDNAVGHRMEVRHDAKGHALYCAVMPEMTGSILHTKVCKTARQWRADGVDLSAVPAPREGA